MAAFSNRSTLIDALKGFAILLVILGHSIQSYIVDYDSNILFRLIYSFHMPLFMFLSGYVTSYLGAHSLQSKITRLVSPFISWYIVSYWINSAYLTINFYDYIMRWIKSPDYGLWFLWVLFLCYCVLAICQRLGKYIPIELSIILVYSIIYFTPVSIMGVGMLKWHFVFFATGYLIKQHQTRFVKYQPYLISAIILYPILFQYWHRLEAPVFLAQLTAIFKAYHIPGSGLITLIFNYCIGFLGITVTYLLIKFAEKLKYISKGLCYLGSYTLDIYVFHILFLRYGFGSGYIKIITASVIALFISLLMSNIIRKIPYVRTAILGIKVNHN